MSQLATIDFTSKKWEDLPSEVRADVRLWISHLHAPPAKGVTRWLQEIATAMGVGYATARTKYYALLNSRGDWTVLVDHRKAPSLKAERTRSRQPVFVTELVTMVEDHKRKDKPAFRALRNRWKTRGKAIPGYEDWPGWPKIPEGWSDKNLGRIVAQERDLARLRSIRVGTSSKTNQFLPTVHTTRVGLWPGAVVQIDDVWHDNFVTLGQKREIVRVLELGALDLFSAHRNKWGAKPRRKTASGSYETIRAQDMRFFIGGYLHDVGFSPRGTMFMSEHATAKIDEDIARILYDSTHGMVRVEYQPIEGKQAALSGFWSGSEGGNFRAKACLESLHNLIHNDLSALGMQTGSPSSGLAAPVTTDRQVAYINRIMKAVFDKVPERAHLVRLPTMDFHSQFIPFLMDYYQFGLAMRTDHDLEGWATLKHIVTEFSMLPNSDHFLSELEFLRLPEISQHALREAARANPKDWSRRRNLSPLEVWNRREKFNAIPPAVLCEIYGQDLAREQTVRRGFIEFEDQEFSDEGLIYSARFCAGPHERREIPHGEKISMFANPHDDATAFVQDAKGRYLGEVPLVKRVCAIDPSAFGSSAPFEQRPEMRSAEFKAAAGHKHERIADILEPGRMRHAGEVQEAREMRAYNKTLLDTNAAVTPDEKLAVREKRKATNFGKAVRTVTPRPTPAQETPAQSDSW